MNVKELIKKLSKYDDNDIVKVIDWNEGYFSPRNINDNLYPLDIISNKKMKIQMKLNNRLFAVIINKKDNDTYEDIINKAHYKIAEQIVNNNEKEGVIFYEELEPVCSECGVSLNLDEEKEAFKCLQCSEVKK